MSLETPSQDNRPEADRPIGALEVVKICGLTRPEDAAAAVRAGADWLGLNFWPGSKRAIDAARGQELAAAARAAARLEAGREGVTDTRASVTLVGVFVNQAADHIADVVADVGLDRVQLHGDEGPEACAALAARGVAAPRVIKALSLAAAADVDRALAWVAAGVDTLLVDTPSAGYGGSGRTFDWTLARALVDAGAESGCQVILAGGLTADNVAQAVARVMPFGVDVASGVETAPGIKDADAMAAFVRQARSVVDSA